VRSALRFTAAFWLTCQLAGVCAAPATLAWMPVQTSSHDDEACCPGLQPGQVCPMHHTREGGKRCLMRNACGSADASLVALVFTSGILPQSTPVAIVFDRHAAPSMSAPVAIARPEPPDPPPPKA